MAGRAGGANLIEVTGGGVSVTYATTGLAGNPSFHYHDAGRDVTVEGIDIRTKKTELGTLVTIDLGVVLDGPSTSATLLVPTINLAKEAEQRLRTVIIVTTTANTIGGPSLVMGQLQSYKAIAVRGTAKAVKF